MNSEHGSILKPSDSEHMIARLNGTHILEGITSLESEGKRELIDSGRNYIKVRMRAPYTEYNRHLLERFWKEYNGSIDVLAYRREEPFFRVSGDLLTWHIKPGPPKVLEAELSAWVRQTFMLREEA